MSPDSLDRQIEAVEDWQLRLRPRDRAAFPASLTVGAVRDSAGGLTGLRWLIRDITERRRAEQELRSTRDQLRALAARRETALEDVRSTVAREAREELAQVLAALKIEVTRMASVLPEDPSTFQQKAREMLPLLDAALKSALHIASDLRPDPLDDLGLMTSIAWQAQMFQRRTGILCHLVSRQEDVHLDQERRTAVFRIFQEVLNSVERHTGVTRISVELEVEGQGVVLVVGDDGNRTVEEGGNGGESLVAVSIQERASRLGGSVSVLDLPEGGTTVRVMIPLRRDTWTPTGGDQGRVSR